MERTAALLPVGLWGQLWIWGFHLSLWLCHADELTETGLQNVSKTIEDLLDGYDIRLRPQFGGECEGPPSSARPTVRSSPTSVLIKNSCDISKQIYINYTSNFLHLMCNWCWFNPERCCYWSTVTPIHRESSTNGLWSFHANLKVWWQELKGTMHQEHVVQSDIFGMCFYHPYIPLFTYCKPDWAILAAINIVIKGPNWWQPYSIIYSNPIDKPNDLHAHVCWLMCTVSSDSFTRGVLTWIYFNPSMD